MNEFLNHLKSRYVDNVRSRAFDENRARVNEENRSGIVLILLFTFAIIIVNLVVQFFSGLNVTPQIVQLGAYILLSLIVYQFALKKKTARYTLWIYLIELPLILISMVTGTVFETHGTTFTFMFVLLVFPPLILDKPQHVAAFVLVLAVAFSTMDYPYKTPDIFSRDMLHLFNVCLISIMASIYYAATRMENIRYAGYFADKAVRDPLTGLYNRAGAESNIDPSQPGALIYVDLDNFKEINDEFGHSEGDRVLEKTAHVLRRSFRDEDVVIRLGGDEFAIFAPGSWSKEAIGRRLKQMLAGLGQIKVPSDGTGETSVLASAGCAISPHGCESLDQMIRLADEKMYQVKETGKNSYRIAELA